MYLEMLNFTAGLFGVSLNNIPFCFPSTLVLRSRRMNWKLDFSPDTRDMMATVGGAV